MTMNESKIVEAISKEAELFWENKDYKPLESAEKEISFSFKDVQDAEARLKRFSSFIRLAYPETEKASGIIESEISEIFNMRF